MAKAPAFQFYANDFMDATRLWDANACGLYVRCMCIQWTHGSIPSDLKILARALHCDRSELESVWHLLQPKFEVGEDGQLRNSRLERVRERQQAVSSKRSDAASARWDAHANAYPNAMQKDIQRKVKEKEKKKGNEEGVQGKQTEPITDQEKANQAAAADHPFNSDAFRLAWYYFEQGRRAGKHPMTPAARTMILRKMAPWTEDQAIEALNNSTRNSWRDVFLPKPERSIPVNGAAERRKSTEPIPGQRVTLGQRPAPEKQPSQPVNAPHTPAA